MPVVLVVHYYVIKLTVKLFTKVMPRFEHHIHPNFGISEEFYGGCYDPLGGLRQGVILLGSNIRGKSFLIFKKLEEKGFGFSNINLITLEKRLKTASTFVDDADF